MNIAECFRLGRLKRTHGTDGSLLLQLENDLPDKNLIKEPVFVQIHQKDEYPVPFFVEEFRPMNKRTLIIRFEEAENMDKAQKLVSKPVYLPRSWKNNQEETAVDINLVGFEVIDIHAGKLGIIEEVIENPGQLLFKVVNGENEILIPAVEEMILGIDREKNLLETDLPEGLSGMNA